MTTHYFNAMSLFSGMGGDTCGIQKAGGNVTAYNEFWDKACESHDANFPSSHIIEHVNTAETSESAEKTKKKVKKIKNPRDIQNIPDETFESYTGNIDLIFAGFPCQGFSNGGKKDEADPRNALFYEFVRVTRIVKPKFVIGENVVGLLSRKNDLGKSYIDVIVEEFQKIGYTVFHKICIASRYGVPQKRQRVIIVGMRNDMPQKNTFTFPEGSDENLGLQHIIEFNLSGALKILPEDFDMASIPDECIITDMENHQDAGDDAVHPYLTLKAKTRGAVYNGKTFNSLLSFAKRDSPIHAEIIDIRAPAKTIICTYDHQPRLFVPLKNSKGYFLRCILPDELKQIQGFPKDYVVLGTKKEQIKQIGNAVPPPLITSVIQAIFKEMK
jgi:DNA (cytosine-5)-methyltransferase 1